MLIPLWFINAIVNQPNGPLSVILSIVPFSAPVAMIARVAQVSVPAWQMALSLILLIAAAYVAIQGAARLFRAQTLLSGQPLSWQRLRQALQAQ
jgi:ABC-2 type transport system permease protein